MTLAFIWGKEAGSFHIRDGTSRVRKIYRLEWSWHRVITALEIAVMEADTDLGGQD